MRHTRVSGFLWSARHRIASPLAVAVTLLATFASTAAQAASPGLRFDTGTHWRDAGLIEPTLQPLSPLYSPTTPTYEHWRLTVSYALIDRPESRFALGMTTRGYDERSHLVFGSITPATLLHAYGEYRLGLKWSVAGNVDTDSHLRRNLDLGLRVGYDLSPVWSLSAGYRMLDQTSWNDPLSITRGSWLTLGTRVRF